MWLVEAMGVDAFRAAIEQRMGQTLRREVRGWARGGVCSGSARQRIALRQLCAGLRPASLGAAAAGSRGTWQRLWLLGDAAPP